MIEMTENAISEIRRLQSQNPSETSSAVLRIRVVGGGCSGMSYKLDFQTEPTSESDKIFEKEGVQIAVDPKSYLFLMGMILDFSGGLNGKGFVFDNPNAKRTCGCGSSFSA